MNLFRLGSKTWSAATVYDKYRYRNIIYFNTEPWRSSEPTSSLRIAYGSLRANNTMLYFVAIQFIFKYFVTYILLAFHYNYKYVSFFFSLNRYLISFRQHLFFFFVFLIDYDNNFCQTHSLGATRLGTQQPIHIHSELISNVFQVDNNSINAR